VRAFGADEPGRLRLLQPAVRVAQHDLTGFGSGESTSCASPTSSTPRSIRTPCLSTAVRRIRNPELR
jgi:hypothetical protein